MSRLLFVLFLINSCFAICQDFLSNPSFEGNTGANVTPFSWTTCSQYSTPDIQPGAWTVVKEPSHGTSYTNLVTRGNLGPFRNTSEDMSTTLLTPLIVGKKYKISIDLARSDDWGHTGGGQWVSYTEGVILDIYAGSSVCSDNNLIWSSPKIEHTAWETYSFEIEPFKEHKTIQLRARWASSNKYFGNVLMDNMKIELEGDAEIRLCEVELPNIITPNGDGLNDKLVFHDGNRKALIKSEFNIYNRWGKLIYSTNEIEIEWDGSNGNGEDVSEGLYYWDISYSCFNGQVLEENHQKGWVQVLK